MCRVGSFGSHLLAEQEEIKGRTTKDRKGFLESFLGESGLLLWPVRRQRRPLSMKMCSMDEMSFVDRLLGADPGDLSHARGILTFHPNS